jgi:hypothetical protein
MDSDISRVSGELFSVGSAVEVPVVVNERAELVSRPNFSTLRPKKVANDWEDAFIFASVKGFGLKLSIEGA